MQPKVLTDYDAIPDNSLEKAIHKAIESSWKVRRFDRFRTPVGDTSLFQYWMIPHEHPSYELKELNDLLVIAFNGTEGPHCKENVLALYNGGIQPFGVSDKILSLGYLFFPPVKEVSDEIFPEAKKVLHFYDIKQFTKDDLPVVEPPTPSGSMAGAVVRLFPDKDLADNYRNDLLAGKNIKYLIPAKYLNNLIK